MSPRSSTIVPEGELTRLDSIVTLIELNVGVYVANRLNLLIFHSICRYKASSRKDTKFAGFACKTPTFTGNLLKM